MLSNDYLTNIEIEIKKLEQIAIKVNISPKKVKYWKNLIKINQNNLKADMYLHLFEKEIRKAIISKSINYSKFWDYRSTASITYEANMKEEANYARSLPPKKIESFFSKNKKRLNEKNCIAFNSGMAAINAVLIIVQKLTKSSLGVYTEYFETTALLKEIMTDIHIYSNKKQLLEDMSFNNFFFLENPISSPNKENVLLEDIYDVISKRINDKKIFILVVDSTLELNDNDY
ncbi:hypothetical protein CBF69_09540, partial [Lactobacillus taiwanensis]|uniref:PLP-dependent transferase n=3 Tax=Lactobacillus taiwanensis TaxID=508451 RepID=UPI000BD6B745